VQNPGANRVRDIKNATVMKRMPKYYAHLFGNKSMMSTEDYVKKMAVAIKKQAGVPSIRPFSSKKWKRICEDILKRNANDK
jgi:hypothetical protein